MVTQTPLSVVTRPPSVRKFGRLTGSPKWTLVDSPLWSLLVSYLSYALGKSRQQGLGKQADRQGYGKLSEGALLCEQQFLSTLVPLSSLSAWLLTKAGVVSEEFGHMTLFLQWAEFMWSLLRGQRAKNN